MKKIAKIALLFTIACVGQLYGMEKPSYGSLLPELKQEIINTALATSKNVDEAISMLKKLSALHGVEFDKLFNLKDFTKLVHVLADKFNISTSQVAQKIDTPVA